MRGHNSTIRLKQRACISCGKPCIWFSKQRCQDCARIEDTLAADSKDVIETEDLSGLIQDADALISRYVRLSAANEKGLVKCFTCPVLLPWTEMDAGHYVSRACLFLRHDLRNLKPQCHECNRMMRGRMATYSVNLDLMQPGIVEELISESRIVHKVTREELRQIISEYSDKLSRIKIPVL